MRVKEFGLVGYAMAHSKTLGAALKRLDRYDRIVAETLNVALDTTDGERRGCAWTSSRRCARCGRRSTRVSPPSSRSAGKSWPHRSIPWWCDCRIAQPERVVEYQQFFRAPLEFGALTTAFLLRTEDLERPVVHGDETLAGYLDQLAEQRLSAVDHDATARDQIRNALWSVLPDGVPELESLARRLGMSGRTLQRRLRDEGTTYRDVLADFRQDAAPALLRDGRLGVSEVAFLLGYEDPASFQRAFRHTFGMPPRAFRRRLAA